ncbi:protein phosphatase 2C 32 [Selaginella moellendorffii]|uniref:protein phosphatase 2C 32 n=1 Tax=Selaginella moellendorffii TaxID=88036 RepID=UPI000D1CB128|nr:protein phosphatase 2C 32 [Selaginella moellendorffii]|eukprot:XP_024538408.1 protein phosphatase 2C 32 [Selaginella moellendorffii]
MGNSVSRVVSCFVPRREHDGAGIVLSDHPLDEGLGHSFCYIRPTLDSSASSPAQHQSGDYSFSHSTSSSIHTDSEPFGSSVEAEEQAPAMPRISKNALKCTISETSFKAISGASVSANTSTSRSAPLLDSFTAFSSVPAAAFESTPSFTALPLQPIPRGIAHSGPITGSSGSCSGPLERGFLSGPLERVFMSGPLERGFLSGPLERDKGGFMSGPLERQLSGPLEQGGGGHFSGPVLYPSVSHRGRKKTLGEYVKDASLPVRRAFSKTVSNIARTRKSLVPHRKKHRRGGDRDQQHASESVADTYSMSSEFDARESHLQWAQGKAGEDRVHIVLSEEHGWMFVGIYDGFNGPDAPDFLMSNLYPAIYKELQRLLWDQKEAFQLSQSPCSQSLLTKARREIDVGANGGLARNGMQATRSRNYPSPMDCQDDCSSLGVMELDGKSSEDRQGTRACGGGEVDGKQVKLKSILGVKLKQACRRKHKGGSSSSYKKLFQWRYDWEHERLESERLGKASVCEEVDSPPIQSRRGRVDHSGVLKALERALEETEHAYLEMTQRSVMDNPEVALVGSCLLVMLMKDEDVYIMNVGDSRAVLAQDTRSSRSGSKCQSVHSSDSKEAEHERIGARDSMLRMELERIIEETPTELAALEAAYDVGDLAPPPLSPTLEALQLSCDHSTSIEEEVMRIRMEHPDDEASIANDRVKGRLKVTRAFGAGYLKQPKLNDAVLEMFRIDFIGDEPYVTCTPSLQHHRLGPRDQFLVLSSDGLYQYLSNEEVVAHVEWFMEKFPDGDPAQYLIEELLFRAAKKAGMDFHELLDIPQGDRRKYHDDVSVMVISLEGRIWRSSG